MCSIIGLAYKQTQDLKGELIKRLRYLEYRGYDSTGVSVLHQGQLSTHKNKGDLSHLEDKIKDESLPGKMGIGHTRWATHGAPSTQNAHPHSNERVAIIHNGIIDNYNQLKSALQAKGFRFETETDTESILHLIDDYLSQGLTPLDIFRRLPADLKGTYAIVALFQCGQILAIRHKSPLVFVQNDQGTFLASDALALQSNTVCYLDNHQILAIQDQAAHVYDLEGHEITPLYVAVQNDNLDVVLQGYQHYMLKETHEQKTIIARIFQSLKEQALCIAKPKRVLILGCGTSYYAGALAKHWFETIARIPVEVEIASEFNSRDYVMDNIDLCILISQSGETFDILTACEKLKHVRKVGLLNVTQSSLAQLVDVVIPICAGREIGVASTKALTANLVVLYYLAYYFAGTPDLFFAQESALITAVHDVFEQEDSIHQLAHTVIHKNPVFFISRGIYYPVALEGALKLKEITYINAQAYPAGELKHGPIALVDDQTLVVTIAPYNALLTKIVSNTQEVIARGAQALFIADTQSAPIIAENFPEAAMIIVPHVTHHFMPILTIIPLQLLTYYSALLLNRPIDKPRNLAKSATVE